MRSLFATAVLAAFLLPAAVSAQGYHPLPATCCAPAGPPPVYLLPHPSPGGYGVCAPATPYAYGWFGVQRRSQCHTSVHYGFYNNRVQHSHR